LGHNGSGKSTLMRMLAAHLSPSKGTITFHNGSHSLAAGDFYRHISYAAPYIDVIEEFTLQEALQFHQQFRTFLDNLTVAQLIEILDFKAAKNKEIRFFSSGMKQRLKLALALCADTSVLLLDEPTSNLDAQGMQWYQELIQEYVRNRLCIVASNVPEDYHFCTDKLTVTDYKPSQK
ncbi:MAG: ATP-binding cassette domain-containing protein, partial [Bacteroidota bacterium]